METKVSTAIGLYKQGQLKKALAIFRNFKRDFNKDEQRTIQIASADKQIYGEDAC